MNYKIALCFSLVLLTAVPSPSAYAAPISSVEGVESKRVANIDITMENLAPSTSFNPKTVLSRLKTKVGDPFSQLTFDSDLKMLADEYDRIEPSVEVQNGETYIKLKIWPRPLIRSIKWTGNHHIKSKKLRKELEIKTGSQFNRQAFNKAFNKLKEFYVKKGYFESEIQYTIIPDEKTNEVDIVIEVREGRSGVIDNIIFKGFSKKEKGQLLEMIYTKKYNLFTSWLTATGTYREEALEQDKLTIVNFLQNKGYADAKVNIWIKEAKKAGKIIIKIETERGALFHFNKVTYEGNILFDDKEIETRFSVRPEAIYSPEKLRGTADAIKEMYGRKGYIDATVEYETQLVEDAPLYNVHFKVEEGQQYKIGLIRVFGNIQTQTGVILHESLLIPGEKFDSAKLKATQKRLESMGYFKNVNVYAVRSKEDQTLGDNYRDVYIEVEETTTGNVSLFFGFSTADSGFGGLELAENNFNYKGIPQLFSKGYRAIRGGGEYAHMRFNVGARQRTYSLAWVTPYFRDSLWRVGFNAEAGHSSLQSKDYNINTLGLSVFASYPLSYQWTFGTKYRVRYSRNRIEHDHDKKERQEADADGVISAIGSSLTYDTTDSALKPHNGLRSIIDAEFAGLGGRWHFLRYGFVNSYYTQLWKGGIMKYRADLRFIEPLLSTNHASDIPLSERFFLGGETSVRGFVPFSLGPHFSNGAPSGGISSTLLSIEYLHELFSFLDPFVFADAGNVERHRFFIGKLRLSYGFGVRLDIMKRLPMIIGMGFPVNNGDKHNVRRFFFSMGGQF